MTTKKISISVVLDPSVIEKIQQLQSDKRIFSRSEMVRNIIDAGIEKVK